MLLLMCLFVYICDEYCESWSLDVISARYVKHDGESPLKFNLISI